MHIWPQDAPATSLATLKDDRGNCTLLFAGRQIGRCAPLGVRKSRKPRNCFLVFDCVDTLMLSCPFWPGFDKSAAALSAPLRRSD